MKNQPIRIHIVEDNEWYNKLLVHSASLNPDFTVKGYRTAKDFFAELDLHPAIVTLDYRLPDMSGAEVLERIKAKSPETEVIIISEQNDVATAVELLRAGAYDYIVKEKDIRSKLLNTLNNIAKTFSLKQEVSELKKEVRKKYEFPNFAGESPQLKKVQELMSKALDTNINVMITGETGTGKEVAAKSIHYNSPRAKKPFVAVNVTAIPSELIESELFGHEKGAFTGATSRRVGKFEEADGGTLFLDEIGDMDLPLQAKLLRVLQEKEFSRVGDNARIKTDCRIIVATHRNLKEEVAKGKFREDLYYRLFGLTIELPPLRERGNDILLLARLFISMFCGENKITEKQLSDEAAKKLLGYRFPGNVRELKALIDLACVMADGHVIKAEDVRFSSEDILPEIISEEATLREYSIRIVRTYLQKYNNDVKTVAKKLNIGPATIYRMLKESSGDKMKE